MSSQTNAVLCKKQIISLETLSKLSIQVGTVVKVSQLSQARKPSYEMDAEFSGKIRKSCGQLVRNHSIKELTHLQILGLTNLPVRRIAGIKSEYLTLGFLDDSEDGQAVALTPCHPVTSGERVVWPNNAGDLVQEIEYNDFEAVEIISATVLKVLSAEEPSGTLLKVDVGNHQVATTLAYGGRLFGEWSQLVGIQIPVVVNADLSSITKNSDTKCLALVLPIDCEHQTEITLVKTIKAVRNGLNLF